MPNLHPTLWRTCRILANQRRLACLRTVLSLPGCTVGTVAEKADLPTDQASLCLRALQARGLIQAKRHSRWVHYTPAPDLSVPVAAPILSALRRALLADKLTDTTITLTLTAFTHPRRLVILKRLTSTAQLTAARLTRETHISPPALWRHLSKLKRRGLVIQTPDGWQLAQALTPLAKAILALIVCRDA